MSNAGLGPDYLANEDQWRLNVFNGDFPAYAHNHQQVPVLAQNGLPWRTWLILGGRGAGKTRTGAEWVKQIARAEKGRRIALIGETERDTRDVMIEGDSGILAVHGRHNRPTWISSRRRLVWSNGTVAEAFSADLNFGCLR